MKIVMSVVHLPNDKKKTRMKLLKKGSEVNKFMMPVFYWITAIFLVHVTCYSTDFGMKRTEYIPHAHGTTVIIFPTQDSIVIVADGRADSAGIISNHYRKFDTTNATAYAISGTNGIGEYFFFPLIKQYCSIGAPPDAITNMIKTLWTDTIVPLVNSRRIILPDERIVPYYTNITVCSFINNKPAISNGHFGFSKRRGTIVPYTNIKTLPPNIGFLQMGVGEDILRKLEKTDPEYLRHHRNLTIDIAVRWIREISKTDVRVGGTIRALVLRRDGTEHEYIYQDGK